MIVHTWLAPPARAVQLICEVIAMVAGAYLLLIVAGSIVVRALFDLTGGSVNLMFNGAIEQSRFALLIMVFAALPAGLQTGFVSVDILIDRFPRLIRNTMQRLWYLTTCVGACTLAWLFYHEAVKMLGRGDVTQDLGWPLYPFYGIIAVECLALALVAFAQTFAPTVEAS